jgi:broad specificity phosphatase PhoE
MTQLILIRHGETDWNVEGRWQGQADVPLNENGLKQAEQIAQLLSNRKIQAIYTSDSTRTRRTAEVLGRVIGLRVYIDIRLREIHQGEWQGLLITEIKERYSEEFRSRRANPLTIAPPGGETTKQVQERALSFIKDISDHYPNEAVAIVSHGFTIAVIVAHLKRIPFEKVWNLVPKNGDLIELDIGKSSAAQITIV